MIKVGQIYDVGGDIMCVTSIQPNFYYYILNNGVTGYGVGWMTGVLIAEYPTWQEAVNSKEFKE